MSKSYDGNEHIFFSLTDDTTVIKPKDGQTLSIEGPLEIIGLSIGTIRFITTLDDLPNSLAGIITLESGLCYFFTESVDLLGARFVGTDICIRGASTSIIVNSAGLVGNLVTGTSLRLSDITLSGNISVSTGNVYIRACIISDCTLASINSFVATDSTLGTCTFTGTLDILNLSTSSIESIICSANVITRINIADSIFNTDAPKVSLNVSGTVPIQSFVVSNSIFNGTGTYLSGYTSTSNETNFSDNIGITNSKAYGTYYISTSIGTTMTLQNTWYKLAGATTLGLASKFSRPSNGRIRYDGTLSGTFIVTFDVSVGDFTGPSGDIYQIGVSKNGNMPDSGTITTFKVVPTSAYECISKTCFMSLILDDYLEIHVQDTSSAGQYVKAFFGSLSVIAV